MLHDLSFYKTVAKNKTLKIPENKKGNYERQNNINRTLTEQ